MTTDQLHRLSDIVLGSPYLQTIDVIDLESVAAAVGAGEKLVVGNVTAVQPSGEQPLNIVPQPNGETTSKAAGNSAVWSGVAVQVEHGLVVVAVPLSAGGPDAVAAANLTDIPELQSMVGACVLAVTGSATDPAALGGARLIAASSSLDDQPIPFDPSFVRLVGKSHTLAELIRAG